MLFRSDGWANGWTVPEGVGSTMGHTYGPDRLVWVAVWTLPLVVLAAVMSLIRSRRVARATSGPSDRSGPTPTPYEETER